MNRRGFLIFALAGPLIAGQACLFRRGKKGTEAPKVYDVLGTIQQVSPNAIVIQTGKGSETFAMDPSTVRGGNFKPGMYVHVYYHREPNQNLATMIVERVK